MARTDISICSRALMRLGAKPITSFDDRSDVAQFLKLEYPELIATICGSYQWECMKKRAELTRESGSPGGFRYQFIMPTDMVSGPTAIFQDDGFTAGTSQFEIRGRRIVTNFERLWAEYSVVKPEAEWPSWFVELVTAAVCASVAFMVTDQENVRADWDTAAYGTPSENRAGGLMGQAQTLDAQSSGNNPGIVSTAFIEARFGGVYPGFEN